MSPQKASAKLVDFIHVDTFHRSAVGEYLLVKSGASLPKHEGIYALLAGDDICYVGSAKRVRSRLKTYLRRQKKGTSTRPVHKHLQQELAWRDVEVVDGLCCVFRKPSPRRHRTQRPICRQQQPVSVECPSDVLYRPIGAKEWPNGERATATNARFRLAAVHDVANIC